MFQWFGGSGGKDDSIPELIKRKRYGRAIELVRVDLEKQPANERLRQQLAELLHLDGKTGEAIEVLKSVADGYAHQGFTVKAIAILKKIQRLDPEDSETDSKLTTMISERESQMVSPAEVFGTTDGAEPSSDIEIGMELVDDDVEPASAQPAPAAGGLEATPLFASFSREELLAVVRGFELQTYEPGDIVVAAGEPGDSLFVIAAGVVKAFVKDEVGHYSMVREMGEGDFFGEISILSGKARTATITAAEWSELLELDRAALDRICVDHPKVREVLQDFYNQRAGNAAETFLRRGGAE